MTTFNSTISWWALRSNDEKKDLKNKYFLNSTWTVPNIQQVDVMARGEGVIVKAIIAPPLFSSVMGRMSIDWSLDSAYPSLNNESKNTKKEMVLEERVSDNSTGGEAFDNTMNQVWDHNIEQRLQHKREQTAPMQHYRKLQEKLYQKRQGTTQFIFVVVTTAHVQQAFELNKIDEDTLYMEYGVTGFDPVDIALKELVHITEPVTSDRLRLWQNLPDKVDTYIKKFNTESAMGVPNIGGISFVCQLITGHIEGDNFDEYYKTKC